MGSEHNRAQRCAEVPINAFGSESDTGSVGGQAKYSKDENTELIGVLGNDGTTS